GTALPLQSRTGSVSTRSWCEAHSLRMRRLHASEATCCTTRTSEALPIDAPTFAGPSFLAEVMRIHATPFSEDFACVRVAPSFGVTLKFRVAGVRTRL